MNDDRKWLLGQVAAYRRLYPRYNRYAGVLAEALKGGARTLAPLAIVQTRPKSIASFAEKALRKRAEYPDPVNQFTDLCGGRVITRTRSEADAFGEWVKESFEIDWDNSSDTSERLKPTEFGYRSVHYIVSFDRKNDLGIAVPQSLHGLKAEVQLRTTTEHAWADFGHDLSYKGAFELPVKWKRELATIAAELEDVDRAFSRIEEGLRAYESSYVAYLSEEEIRNEMATLESVLEHDKKNPELAWRIGNLAIRSEDWAKAVAVREPYADGENVDSAYQPLLRDLGVALCKLHRASPRGRAYRRGQRYLERASQPPHRDSDALASLAGTWKGIDDDKARDLYRRAFELDPTDYYPLGNFLEYELLRTRDTSMITLLRPTITAAIERCRAQAEVGVNLPWAYYGIAKLHLLLGEPGETVKGYAKAVQASTARFMVEGARAALEKLSVVSDELEGYESARRMVMLGMATKFPDPKIKREVRKLSSTEYEPVQGPVVIVVGGTHPTVEPKMRAYRRLVLEAFRDFRGTIVCGGTKQGVSGLVGEVGKRYSDRVRTLAYVPDTLPPDATLDERYGEIRRTAADRFTALEPLQSWIDLVASGIEPRDVKVLGINGGDIAAIEFRVALGLGASVGVLQDSGRAAARLLADETWAVSERLVPLVEDAQTVRAFIGSGRSKLPPEMRETIAAVIHEEHRMEAVSELPAWDGLQENLKESSRQQADHIVEKLKEIGCGVREVEGREIALMTFKPEEVDVLAEMEHGRWNAERLSAGWTWGPEKDVDKKISPYLVSWAELPEGVREWDRATVRKIPKYLAAVGLEISRDGKDGVRPRRS